MGKLTKIDINENVYEVYVGAKTPMNYKCIILDETSLSLNLGTTFNQKWVSLKAIVIAQDLGIILSDENVLKNITEKKEQILQTYLSNKESYSADNIVMDAAEKRATSEELEKLKNIIVTTGDIKVPYEIIGPVYFQVSNKGLFSSQLSKLINQYSNNLEMLKSKNLLQKGKIDWGVLYGEWSVGQNDFDKAFYISIEELKKRALSVGADAIVNMRQDIDLDTKDIQRFYMQMYGTAVKRSVDKDF